LEFSKSGWHSTVVAEVKNRLYNLDYLRGLAALGIMVYHYSSWIFGELSAATFLGRLGIYGVAVFYVLSGLTLTYVYRGSITLSRSALLHFYKKRLFRIFPLLWAATIISVVLSKHAPNPEDLLLNLTGLFGLVKWHVYFATGAWSIGNELAFYAVFPLLIFIAAKSKPGFFALFFLAFSIHNYFAFHVLHAARPLAEQWRDYTNPLNQFFFFMGGSTICLLFRNIPVKPFVNLLLGLTGLCLFLLLPVTGNAVELVTGFNRVWFTVVCFLLCFSFYRLTLSLPALIHKPLTLLGQASYSVYLLHPIVFAITKAGLKLMVKDSHQIPDSIMLFLPIGLSLVVSRFVYEYFEKYFIKLAR
jgi:exopolysaccharide production protein ExoZ